VGETAATAVLLPGPKGGGHVTGSSCLASDLASLAVAAQVASTSRVPHDPLADVGARWIRVGLTVSTRRDYYRVKFEGRPDLDSDDFVDTTEKGIEIGDEHTFEGKQWRVKEIVPGEGDQPALAVFELL
jgi:hypothetical protein